MIKHIATVAALLTLSVSASAWAVDPEEYGRRLQADHDRVGAQVQRCQMEQSRIVQRPEDLARGIVQPMAPCMNYMPQWTAQLAFDECQLYRLRTGDRQTSCFQISGVQITDE